MAGYFSNVPDFDYVDRNPNSQSISDFTTVKNLFKRGKIREEIFGKSQYFNIYNIVGDARPDNVAFEVYGDETYDWVILLSNNIMNLNSEWPKTQYSFDKYVLEKYGSDLDTDEEIYNRIYNGIHHYETQDIVNSKGVKVLKSGLRVSNQWRTNGNWIETNTSKILNIYSGNGTRSSKTVTVILYGSGIQNLKVGDEVRIENIKQEPYNGVHIVSELVQYTNLNSSTYSVTSFSYELPTAPEIAKPELSFVLDNQGIPVGAQLEEARFTIKDGSITGNAYYFEYFDYRLKKTVQVKSSDFLTPVTNYEYEAAEEDKKRSIYILKPEFLFLLLEDIDAIMPYQEGGEQYIGPYLKRGENIKLFE